MNNSFRIGSVFGITIRVHWLFLPLVWFFLFLMADPLSGLLLVGSLFLFVFLHELGHSLMAKHFGIHVLDITFWPLGGMARMSEIPENSRVEALIAAAGPAVNFALLGLFAGLHALFGGGTPLDLAGLGWVPGETSLFAAFARINLWLGAFNLIPAFPMDGGRLLRATLATRYDWLEATERAVKVGRVLAVMMLFAAVFIPGMFCTVPLIAAFIWIAGGRELLVTRLRHAPQFQGAAGGRNPLEEVVRAWARAAGAAGASGAAAPRAADVLVGSDNSAEDAAPEDAAPQEPLAQDPRQAPRGGFSDADVEELERFRGRLGPRGQPPA